MAILEQLGKLVDCEALTDSDTYVGHSIDLVSAAQGLGVGTVWIDLVTNVAASYADADETYEFQVRVGTGTSGGDINAGAIIVISTGAIDGDDARVATAGAPILQCTLPYQANLQYLQLYYAAAGTSCTITVDFSLSPSKPTSPRNVQVITSNVGLP